MPSFTRDAGRGRVAWLDARFLIGVGLVLASVAGVWAVVSAARDTRPVLAVAEAIVPGQAITAADVVEVDAQLGSVAENYVRPAELDHGLVATRPVAAGELLPAGAVGAAADIDLTTVVVRSALEVPSDVAVGSTVELWAAPVVAPGEYGEPAVIVPWAIVANVGSDEGVVSQQGAVLELIVPRDAVGVVLQHASGGSALSAVPAIAPRGAEPPAKPTATPEPGAGEDATDAGDDE